MTSPSPRILVAIATYKRVDLLKGLLTSLDALQFETDPDADITIAVIENDPGETARDAVCAHSEHSPFKVIYEVENRPGVTHVRNRALSMAKDYDFLAFIDDDEFATPNWLDELLRRQKTTGATAVFGPVRSVYSDKVSAWIADWAPHATPYETDAIMSKPGATCNCLISMSAIADEDLTFDPKMSLLGGEDTLFFSKLMDRGHILAQSSTAIVHEHIPDNRAQVSWLLRRWYRTGMTDAMIGGRNASQTSTRIKAVVGGLVRIGAGLSMAATTYALSLGKAKIPTMNRLYTASRGAGMIAFAFGFSYEEYGNKKAD